jgi:hypothetical protein
VRSARDTFFRTEWNGWRVFNLVAELALVMAALGGAAPPPATISRAEPPVLAIAGAGSQHGMNPMAQNAAPGGQPAEPSGSLNGP